MSKSDYTEYILRFSFGKDSFKTLDVIWTRGLPLDRITTTDVWATDTIPAWLPPMDEFKARAEEWIWSRYRMEVEHLCAMNKDGTKKTYEQMFYHVPNRRSQTVQVERERERRTPARLDQRLPGSLEQVVSVRSQEKSQSTECKEPLPDSLQTPDTTTARSSKFTEGTIKGFPLSRKGNGVKWCQDLKTQYRSASPNERPTRGAEKTNIVEYLGIAADEPDRFGQLNDRKRAPLVEFGIEEPLCGLYCQYNNILSPSYETSCRDGCWFCHNQGVDQLRNLWRNYPDRWALLMKWDLDSPVSFKADGHTVHDFDRRFQMEEDGLVPMDRTFRWAPVESYISMFDILRNNL